MHGVTMKIIWRRAVTVY